MQLKLYLNVDLVELKKQKLTVLRAGTGMPLSQVDQDNIDGLLGLIDAIQDSAVEQGADPEVVFPNPFPEAKK